MPQINCVVGSGDDQLHPANGTPTMWYRVGGCPPKPQWPHQERYLQQRHVALQGGLRDGESAGQVGIVDELADSGR